MMNHEPMPAPCEVLVWRLWVLSHVGASTHGEVECESTAGEGNSTEGGAAAGRASGGHARVQGRACGGGSGGCRRPCSSVLHVLCARHKRILGPLQLPAQVRGVLQVGARPAAVCGQSAGVDAARAAAAARTRSPSTAATPSPRPLRAASSLEAVVCFQDLHRHRLGGGPPPAARRQAQPAALAGDDLPRHRVAGQACSGAWWGQQGAGRGRRAARPWYAHRTRPPPTPGRAPGLQ